MSTQKISETSTVVGPSLIDHIWEGVYERFEDAPAIGEGFNSQRWLAQSLEKVTALLEQSKVSEHIPATIQYRENLLPFLVSLLIHETRKVSILDFGGGLGATYVPVSQSVSGDKRLEYHIVDLQGICDLGSSLFKGDERVHFHSELPLDLNKVDIVHIESALQYIIDWKKALIDLADYDPEFYLLTNLSAGSIPTYATTQQYYGSKIPYWFFNLDDVIEVISKRGYSLVFKSTFIHQILGKEQEFPQPNFPENLRLGHACNLLFRRAKAA